MRTKPSPMRASAPLGRRSKRARDLLALCDAGALWRSACAFAFLSSLSGCASPRVPDPEEAVRAYQLALEERNADALYELLTLDARAQTTLEEVRRLLESQQGELVEQSRRLNDDDALVRQRGVLFLSDGQRVELTIEEGQFRLSSGAGLPSAATDPFDAVREFRAAMLARDFARVRGALSERASQRFDGFFSSLEATLVDAEWGVLEVRGERAELSLPNGRSVQLRKEKGLWKVEEVQ